MTEPDQTERPPVERALTAGGGALVGGALLWWAIVDSSVSWPADGWPAAAAWAGAALVIGCSWLARGAVKDAWPHRHSETLDFVITAGISALIIIGSAATATTLLVAGGKQVDGATVEASIEEGAAERGADGVTATCPSEMTARDGDEDTCSFTGTDGSSGSINVTWDGDDGQFSWLVEVSVGAE